MGAAGDAAIGRESRELMSAADVGRTISRIAHRASDYREDRVR